MVQLTTPDIVSLLAILILFLYLVLRDSIFYARPYRTARKGETGGTPGQALPSVSVIICARNEAEHLAAYLPAILTQDYPDYEVIVVNAGSTDRTDETLSQLKARFPHLYYTYIPQGTRYLSPRKLALTLGIKAAQKECLLFTEAYCEPNGPHWIASVARNYQPETTVVLGYCQYNHHASLADHLIAYDNLLTGVRQLASALGHHPYAGDGRDLSYRKEEFFRHKGFSSSLFLNRGDDDLFINEIANGTNTRVALAPESFTSMARYDRFQWWLERKAALAATQRHYKGAQTRLHQFDDAAYLLFSLLALGTILFALLTGRPLLILPPAFLLLVRFAIRAHALHRDARQLGQRLSIGRLLLLEPVLPLLLAVIRLGAFSNGKKDYTYFVDD